LPARLDVVIPVFNEGPNIVEVLQTLAREVRTPIRVMVCYDFDEDDTLVALRSYPDPPFEVTLVKNRARGPHAAVLTGFARSDAEAVLVYPADDKHNAAIVDRMYAAYESGCDLVAASRFMPGGTMEGCPWLKAVLVRGASFTLHHLARLPVRDATSGFRLFSRRLLDAIEIESTEGFTYSIELLVKAHRRGFRLCETPAVWIERRPGEGKSSFKLLRWLPAYLRWYRYAFATTWLRRSG
jgi:dolichol-phosphate mannosyltransferase